MSELCLSITLKSKTSNLLFSAFTFLFSLVISHPLYFLCLVLSFPYLLKLLSFLSPLFITTSLLLIAFLTIVLQKFKPKIDDEYVEGFHSTEALEVYKTVFDTSVIDERVNHFDGLEENPEEKILQAVESSVVKIPVHNDEDGALSIHEDLSVNCGEKEAINIMKVMQGKRIEDFLKEGDEFDESNNVYCSVKEEKVDPPPCTIVDKFVDQQEEESILMNGSGENSSLPMKIRREGGRRACQPCVTDTSEHKALPSSHPSTTDITDNYVSRSRTGMTDTFEHKTVHSSTPSAGETDMSDPTECKIKAHSQRLSSKSSFDYTDNGGEYTSTDIGRYGSMRKEKEWNRTLACKLFEERHKNADDGGEGMDLLWETYEMELTKLPNSKTNVIKKKDCKPKGRIELQHQYLDEEDEEEDDTVDGNMCCLQALKFSAGKMNMGVGRRNLVKFSKAVKGFGWLHHVSKTHRKKVHNGDNF